jgi:hypothetical protein
MSYVTLECDKQWTAGDWSQPKKVVVTRNQASNYFEQWGRQKSMAFFLESSN